MGACPSRAQLYARLRQEIESGGQAYIVCPLVDASAAQVGALPPGRVPPPVAGVYRSALRGTLAMEGQGHLLACSSPQQPPQICLA